jgi:hypothetical protein
MPYTPETKGTPLRHWLRNMATLALGSLRNKQFPLRIKKRLLGMKEPNVLPLLYVPVNPVSQVIP